MVPTHSVLGRHIIEYLVEAEFDVGCSNHLDYDKGGRSRGGVGHAFGFVYHRIMADALIPTVQSGPSLRDQVTAIHIGGLNKRLVGPAGRRRL